VPASPHCMGGSKHDHSWSKSCVFAGCSKIKHL
jgi:hypothetical protein